VTFGIESSSGTVQVAVLIGLVLVEAVFRQASLDRGTGHGWDWKGPLARRARRRKDRRTKSEDRSESQPSSERGLPRSPSYPSRRISLI